MHENTRAAKRATALASRAIVRALARDGWSSARNTAAPVRALRRAYAELVAAGYLRLAASCDRYEAVPRAL